MTIIDTNDTQLSAALIDSLIGETWVDDLLGPNQGKTWEVLSFNPAGVGYFSCRIKGSRGGKDSVQSLTLMQLLSRLGRTAAPGTGADAQEVPQAIDGSDLIGKSWFDENGNKLTADRLEDGQIVAIDCEDFERLYAVDEVRALLSEEASEPTQEPTPEILDNEIVVDQVDQPAAVAVDPELFDAGAEADAQYRERQLDRKRERATYHLPDSTIEVVERRMNELLAALFKVGGDGAVTLKIKAKAKMKAGEELRQADLAYDVDLKMPKLKADGSFWGGPEIIPGVPHRAPDDQLTVMDVLSSASVYPDYPKPPGQITPKASDWTPPAGPAPAASPEPLTLTPDQARAVLVYPGDQPEAFRAIAVAMAKADPGLLEGLDVDPLMLERIKAEVDPGDPVVDVPRAAAAEPPGETVSERIAADEASDGDEIPPYGGSEEEEDVADDEGGVE